ncbi:MAG: hypothetical protein HY553_11630, partial [Elusimicrobia bacterium]|nr:hypothetical protein [Elusimicrobiota bacterium]
MSAAALPWLLAGAALAQPVADSTAPAVAVSTTAPGALPGYEAAASTASVRLSTEAVPAALPLPVTPPAAPPPPPVAAPPP